MATMFERIYEILNRDFIFADEVAEVLAVALTAKKNLILWGPAGHGKSMMVQAVIDGLGLAGESFFQSFGEGLDEAALWGGLDFGKLEREHVLEYFPERSFLASRIAVFEEIFDAPASVLLSIKDTLTAGVLRKGAQQFPMHTEVVIGLTNREPGEIAEAGPAAQALVERFPLQLRVDWPSYTAEDYTALYKKVSPLDPGLNGFTAVLAEVVAGAVERGEFVSPRTAVYARDVVIGRALARGAEKVEKVDLQALRFVEGLEAFGEDIAEEVEAALARARASEALAFGEVHLGELVCQLEEAASPIRCLQAAKRLQVLEDELSGVAVPDELVERRNDLRSALAERIGEARGKAEELTRV